MEPRHGLCQQHGLWKQTLLCTGSRSLLCTGSRSRSLLCTGSRSQLCTGSDLLCTGSDLLCTGPDLQWFRRRSRERWRNQKGSGRSKG